jgi:hypothetical protein
VGVYSNYWNIPAEMVFELPEEIRDAYYGKGEIIYGETNLEEIITEEEVTELDILLLDAASHSE